MKNDREREREREGEREGEREREGKRERERRSEGDKAGRNKPRILKEKLDKLELLSLSPFFYRHPALI